MCISSGTKLNAKHTSRQTNSALQMDAVSDGPTCTTAVYDSANGSRQLGATLTLEYAAISCTVAQYH